jgi:hypothetical protein
MKTIFKWELNTCPLFSLAKNQGFKEHELNQIAHLVVKHQQKLIEAWHEYFGA